MDKFEGVQVFSATKANDREVLGERITTWLKNNPGITVVDKQITQSSDNEFHCLAITIFFMGEAKWQHPSQIPVRDNQGNGSHGYRPRG